MHYPAADADPFFVLGCCIAALLWVALMMAVVEVGSRTLHRRKPRDDDF